MPLSIAQHLLLQLYAFHKQIVSVPFEFAPHPQRQEL